MEIRELRPRLRHWRARHPEWEEDGPDQEWDPIVESYAYVTPAGDELVLVDPLVPADDSESFWEALDRDIAAHGPPQIVLTIFFHERSSREILERHGGTVWTDERRKERVAVPAQTYLPGDRLPGGLVAHDGVGRPECVLWLEEHRALFTGDMLHGGEGGVRLCPDDWLVEGQTPDGVRRALESLLDLPIELVLTTHGAPVLEDGHAALERALRS